MIRHAVKICMHDKNEYVKWYFVLHNSILCFLVIVFPEGIVGFTIIFQTTRIVLQKFNILVGHKHILWVCPLSIETPTLYIKLN